MISDISLYFLNKAIFIYKFGLAIMFLLLNFFASHNLNRFAPIQAKLLQVIAACWHAALVAADLIGRTCSGVFQWLVSVLISLSTCRNVNNVRDF